MSPDGRISILAPVKPTEFTVEAPGEERMTFWAARMAGETYWVAWLPARSSTFTNDGRTGQLSRQQQQDLLRSVGVPPGAVPSSLESASLGKCGGAESWQASFAHNGSAGATRVTLCGNWAYVATASVKAGRGDYGKAIAWLDAVVLLPAGMSWSSVGDSAQSPSGVSASQGVHAADGGKSRVVLNHDCGRTEYAYTESSIPMAKQVLEWEEPNFNRNRWVKRSGDTVESKGFIAAEEARLDEIRDAVKLWDAMPTDSVTQLYVERRRSGLRLEFEQSERMLRAWRTGTVDPLLEPYGSLDVRGACGIKIEDMPSFSDGELWWRYVTYGGWWNCFGDLVRSSEPALSRFGGDWEAMRADILEATGATVIAETHYDCD